MNSAIVNNKRNIFQEEASVQDIIVSVLDKAYESNTKLSIYFAINLNFFDSFKTLIPHLKKLHENHLLSKINILLGSEIKKNAKEFLFLVKNDSISLSEENYSFIKQLYDQNIIRFKLNIDSNFSLKLLFHLLQSME